MQEHERAQLYRHIVENAADAVIFADRKGAIQVWNGGAEAVFGYTAQEAIGQSLDLIVPERQRDQHWAGYDRVMESGETKYGRDLLAVPAMHKNGTRISIEFSIVLVKDSGGKVEGIAAIMRDVTKRWNEERQTRRRLAELERQAGARP